MSDAITKAAVAWWRGKCPMEWTEAEHILQPRVNCVTPREARLALAVARMLTPEHDPSQLKRLRAQGADDPERRR